MCLYVYPAGEFTLWCRGFQDVTEGEFCIVGYSLHLILEGADDLALVCVLVSGWEKLFEDGCCKFGCVRTAEDAVSTATELLCLLHW